MPKHYETQEMLAHKNCWFWLLTTIFGMCVVDFHHLYLNSIERGATTIQYFNVRKNSDFICHTLSGTYHKPRYKFLIHRVGNDIYFIEHLVPITDRNGQIKRDPIYKQRNIRKTCGNLITNNCFVCRNYLQRNGMTQYNTKHWWCKLCKFPLCAVDC